MERVRFDTRDQKNPVMSVRWLFRSVKCFSAVNASACPSAHSSLRAYSFGHPGEFDEEYSTGYLG